MAQILIVDDDSSIAGLLFELLKSAGFEAQIARDGQKALEVLRKMKPLPSIIILDLVMPVMNGWQFRRAQLQDPELASVPVIVMSGTAAFDREVVELRADGILRKPVVVEKLFALLRRFCQQSSARA